MTGGATYDAIVLGAGVAGSAAAYALARDRRVLVLEQHAFLHKQGSSHGGSRIFRYAYEDARYVALAAEAEGLWRALERDQQETLLTRTGGLDIGAADSVELSDIARALHASGQACERLTPAEVEGRFPAFRLVGDQAALYQPGAGILAATRAVNALLRGAARRGAALQDREPVTDLALAPGRVRVTTPRGRYEAGHLVVTAGPWLGAVLADLSLPLRVEQQQVLYARVAPLPEHALGRMPIFINRAADAEVYGFPLFDDPVAIKLSDHAGAPTITLEERHTDLMRARAEATLRRARAFLPGVTGELRAFDLCLYTKTPDEHFILDRHPEHPHVAIGGGFSGHGFKFGPVLGEVLRELALGEGQRDLGLFSLSRFAGQAAAF
jgi:sarcosine oxidase